MINSIKCDRSATFTEYLVHTVHLLYVWVFWQFEGRKYCEHDFQMLFAPCCHQCGESIHFSLPVQSCKMMEAWLVSYADDHTALLSGEFIIGRVIKAMNNSWHPDCFCCDICRAVLADVGFVKNAGRLVASHPTFYSWLLCCYNQLACFNALVMFNYIGLKSLMFFFFCPLFVPSGTCVVRVTTERKLEGSGSTSARSVMPSLRNDLCCSRMIPITPITSTATTAGKHVHIPDQQQGKTKSQTVKCWKIDLILC